MIAAAVAGANTGVPTAAEQNQQDDDPAPVAAAKTVITHKITSENLFAAFAAHSKIFRSRKCVQCQIEEKTPEPKLGSFQV